MQLVTTNSKQLSPAQIALLDTVAEMSIQYWTQAPLTVEIPKSKNIVLQRNGTWEIFQNSIGVFTAKVNSEEHLGLKDELKTQFHMRVPKIPSHIMAQVTRFYQDMCKIDEREAHAYIYYDTVKQNWFILVTPQQTSKGGVIGKMTDCQLKTLRPPRYLLVADTHSHNTMGPFFSGTDDGDDVTYRLHIVIGSLDKGPAINIRAGASYKWIGDIRVEDVCDSSWDKILLEASTVRYNRRFWEKLTKTDMGATRRHTAENSRHTIENPRYMEESDEFFWAREYSRGFEPSLRRFRHARQLELDLGARPFDGYRKDHSEIPTTELREDDIVEAILDLSNEIDQSSPHDIAQAMKAAMTLVCSLPDENLSILVAVMLDMGLDGILEQAHLFQQDEKFNDYWRLAP